MFLLFFGFRGYIGSDWFNYNLKYESTLWNVWTADDYEIGFSFLMKMSKLLGLSYQSFVLGITLIQVFLINKLFGSYLKYVSLGYILLIALFPIVIIDLLRNFTAILIGMFAIPYIIENKKTKAILIILLAVSFHTSSVFLFFLFFIGKKVINKRLLVVLSFLGIIVYLLEFNFYKDFLEMIGSAVGGRIEHLLNQGADDTEKAYGITWGILEKIVLLGFIIIYYNRVIKYNAFLVNSCIIYLLVYLYFSTSQSFINRFSNLFLLGYIYMYTNVVLSVAANNSRFWIRYILLFCFMRTGLSYNNELYTYSNNILSDDNVNTRFLAREQYYKNR
ncbi:EpsG family protein [Flavobacterium sp. HSC-61S13]|uniref:EpsG family protein n=1 Tax=Flavobacterium sp. HSC-61S13 TaxID=2910963 RepID=UPI00209CF9F2|nr:hypothetical protein [Flavobacterium sp. HSC-61S13]